MGLAIGDGQERTEITGGRAETERGFGSYGAQGGKVPVGHSPSLCTSLTRAR